MKNIKLFSILATVVALTAGTYAIADGRLNDADYTREHGGVGNYLFYGDKVKAEKMADAQTNFDTEPQAPATVTKADTVNLGASSAGRAH